MEGEGMTLVIVFGIAIVVGLCALNVSLIITGIKAIIVDGEYWIGLAMIMAGLIFLSMMGLVILIAMGRVGV
jgi:hypothetical protein